MHKISCPQTRRVRQSTDGGNIRLISVRLKANQCFRPGAETGSGFNNGVSLKAFRHRHKFTHRARESGKRRQSKRPGTGQEPAVVIHRNHSRYRVSGRVTRLSRAGEGADAEILEKTTRLDGAVISAAASTKPNAESWTKKI